SLSKNQGKIGSLMEILVEARSENGIFYGRSSYQAPEIDGVTFIKTKNAKIGTCMQTRITEADEYDLTGVPA
ncbi:MAG: TRAM domain-containing protein, partial [Desulfobacterales bacterium]